MRCLTILNLESKFMIDRTEYSIMALNFMINANLKEINNITTIIQVHELHQNRLRGQLKAGCQNGYEKQKIERQIHNNKIIIRGMAQYIVKLRSEMKQMQRKASIILRKKNDTEKA